MSLKIISKIFRAVRYRFSHYIVRPIFCHCFNPFYTLYFNFIFFPFKQAVKMPAFVYGWPKLFSQFGSFECEGECHVGMLRLNVSYSEGPQYSVGNTELLIYGKVILKRFKNNERCEIGSGCRINVLPDAEMVIGGNSKIANSCNITVYSKLSIGTVSRIAHRCQIIDSNYHFIADFTKRRVKRLAAPISIGDYCWICNSTTVTGGSVIPNRIIVGSNSLVNKDLSSIPEGSIVGGAPAKLITSGMYRVENDAFEREIADYFIANPNETVFNIDENLTSEICDVR